MYEEILIKYLVLLSILISCFNHQIAYATVYKTIRVVTTKTLYTQFGKSTTFTKNYVSAKIKDLNYSFDYFGISFTPTFSIITYNDFPADDCPLNTILPCNSTCDSVLSKRHKNYMRNLNWLSYYSFQNNDFIVAMQGNVFNGGILGVVEYDGGRRMVTTCPSNQLAIIDSRVLQCIVRNILSRSYRLVTSVIDG